MSMHIVRLSETDHRQVSLEFGPLARDAKLRLTYADPSRPAAELLAGVIITPVEAAQLAAALIDYAKEAIT